MYRLVSIFIFSTALLVGRFSVPFTVPTIYENLFPMFSESEASALLGRRVRNSFSSEKFVGMKCAQDAKGLLVLDSEYNFTCEKVQIGEMGT